MTAIPTKLTDMIGIIGVISLLSAYYLLNTNKVTAHSLLYQLLNLAGAFLILYSLLFDWNLPAAMIEIVWMLISIIGIYHIWRGKRQ